MLRRGPRRLALASALLVVAATGVACGSDDTGATATEDPASASSAEPTPEGTPEASPADEPTDEPTEDAPERATIEITVADGEITPSGEEVDVALGEEVDLVVTADAPGEIHVHSVPEAEFEYDGTGEPETFTLSIDRPGQVEVESHTLDALIVKLVVS